MSSLEQLKRERTGRLCPSQKFLLYKSNRPQPKLNDNLVVLELNKQ